MKIRAVGIDAAMANMGFALVEITPGFAKERTETVIRVLDLQLVSTEKESGKQASGAVVRVSSDKLRRAQELLAALRAACEGSVFAFAEIPSSPQSAAAATAFGIATGILAACPIPLIEVSPMEVKAAIAGKRVKKGATKAEIIEWAAARHPDAPWLRAKSAARGKGGVLLPAGRLTADNEHCADAVAVIEAGVATPEFQRLMQLYQSNAIPNPADRRSTPRVQLRR